jgi:hypothetical protein
VFRLLDIWREIASFFAWLWLTAVKINGICGHPGEESCLSDIAITELNGFLTEGNAAAMRWIAADKGKGVSG